MSSQIDLFAELERMIEQTFQDEIATFRAKRDEGLEHVRRLRNGWGETTPAKVVDPQAVVDRVKGAINDATSEAFTPNKPAVYEMLPLKAAIIAAIKTLPGPVTRGMVMKWVTDRYPVHRHAKEGTVASTFSRVKADYLEPVEGEGAFVFRLKPGFPRLQETSRTGPVEGDREGDAEEGGSDGDNSRMAG